MTDLVKQDDIDWVIPYIIEMTCEQSLGKIAYSMEIYKPEGLILDAESLLTNFGHVCFLNELSMTERPRMELVFKANKTDLFFYLYNKKLEYDKTYKCDYGHGGIAAVYIFDPCSRQHSDTNELNVQGQLRGDLPRLL